MASYRPIHLLSGFGLFLLMTFSAAAAAQDSGCSQATGELDAPGSSIKPGTDHPAASGLRVYIDPQTGELLDQPPPGQAALAEPPAQALPELVEEVQADGSVRIRLDDRFSHPLVAEMNDGELVTCHEAPGKERQHDQP